MSHHDHVYQRAQELQGVGVLGRERLSDLLFPKAVLLETEGPDLRRESPKHIETHIMRTRICKLRKYSEMSAEFQAEGVQQDNSFDTAEFQQKKYSSHEQRTLSLYSKCFALLQNAPGASSTMPCFICQKDDSVESIPGR